MHRSELTVDLGALRRNVVRLREAASPAELWAVVKSDAYGHGAAEVAPAAVAAGATGICVATVAEGVALRPAIPDARILVLGALTPGEEAPARADTARGRGFDSRHSDRPTGAPQGRHGHGTVGDDAERAPCRSDAAGWSG